MSHQRFFVILAIAAGIGAWQLFGSPPSPSANIAFSSSSPSPAAGSPVPGPALAKGELPDSHSNPSSPSSSQNGIEASVSSVNRSSTNTRITLTLNNHQFDLSQEAAYQSSTLGKATPIDINILEGGPGGHHAKIELIFPPDSSGALTVTPIEGTIFTFSDV